MAERNVESKRTDGKLIVFFALIALVAIGAILLGMSLLGALGGQMGGGCVALVKVTGEIVPDDSPSSLFGVGTSGSETIAKEIEDAGNRSDVKAILLMVDSPGGSPMASREIYAALKKVNKPKVAYLREMAASGGYYVASGADYIVSEPDTLTGSIGVRSSFSDLSGLFEKVGYNETELKSGELKDIGNPSRPMTEKEKKVMQSIIDEIFTEFKGVVMESRGNRLDMRKFEEVLDARVLSGRQAYQIGLVDQIGDKNAATLKASQLAGSEEKLEVCEISEKKGGLMSSLLGEFAILPTPKVGIPHWKLQY